MDEFINMGFAIPKILTNNKGIEVHIPEDENSSNWFIHIPFAVLKNANINMYNRKYILKGFQYYGLTKQEVIRIIKKYQ